MPNNHKHYENVYIVSQTQRTCGTEWPCWLRLVCPSFFSAALSHTYTHTHGPYQTAWEVNIYYSVVNCILLLLPWCTYIDDDEKKTHQQQTDDEGSANVSHRLHVFDADYELMQCCTVCVCARAFIFLCFQSNPNYTEKWYRALWSIFINQWTIQ